MRSLTDRQQQLLNYLKSYIEINQNSPSFEEIKTHFGFASLSSVYKHLHALKKLGFIHISNTPKKMISLQKPKTPSPTYHYEFPLIGCITDEGEIEYFEEMKKIPYTASKKYSFGCFLLKVQGGNFLEAGLLHNDYIIVEPRTEAIPGETILSKVYGESFFIKKYFPKSAYVRLDSFCMQVEPMLVLSDEVSIHGVLLGIIRNYSES